VPRSTYRLQITEDFDLFEATTHLQYLHDLGVDWVYLSPLLAAEAGSTHGYDVVSFEHVDDSRGGPEGLAALSEEAHRLGMGVLVDIVPNHVGIATPAQNAWWWDVLRRGRSSPYAEAFDIDWDFGHGRVRVPVLGDDDVPVDGGPIGNLQVVGDELRYHDQRFPIAPGTALVSTGSTDVGDPPGATGATAVHERQHYELVGWRRADAELNYRRFFAVNTLAGVRVELPEVFASTHTEIRRWFTEGLVDGLRVDHPDGLRDPGGYLDDLARLTGNAYVLVETILEPGEELERAWATAGTTGYDVLALLDRTLTDPAGQEPLDALEARLRGAPLDWEELVLERKRDVADHALRSETNRIVRELPDLVLASAEGFEDAVAELLACFAVYRSYLPQGRHYLDEAFARARRTRPDLGPVLDRLEPVLGDPEQPAALRFQQTSGMVMAKGVEDCAFYRSSRLTSLNEVGADPGVFSITPAQFHEAMAVRQREWPHAMTTLSTHDTKRGEDVRARITVLAEIPQVWADALDELLALVPLPDPGFGALLWQAVLGAWPASVDGEPPKDLRDRLHGYAEKAMREAGDRTTWTDPDAAYEEAVHEAVDAVFDDARTRAVLTGLLDRVAAPGWSNALAAKLVAITAPGVCDVYQGSELWEQSLVDPDNRRPVDFDRRQDLLDRTRKTPPARPTSAEDEGAAKLWVTHTALRLRRDVPELFTGYAALEAHGAAADHVLAFDRGGAVTVVTRLPVGLAQKGGWGDTTLELPDGRWRDSLSGFETLAGARSSTTGDTTTVRLADLMTDLPVALLVKED
jgi:(1->4)-alpha-D-glucan 1-alpha-D-glucosylmutase